MQTITHPIPLDQDILIKDGFITKQLRTKQSAKEKQSRCTEIYRNSAKR